MLVAKNEEAIKEGTGPEKGKFECCTRLKTEALKMILEKYDFDALFLAIRRDEHGIRAKERYFYPGDENFQWNYEDQPLEMRDQFERALAGHVRVHPILHWRELDVWRYIQMERIPANPLYFSKEGKRHLSLGCVPCTTPVESDARTIDNIVKELETTKRAEREKVEPRAKKGLL